MTESGNQFCLNGKADQHDQSLHFLYILKVFYAAHFKQLLISQYGNVLSMFGSIGMDHVISEPCNNDKGQYYKGHNMTVLYPNPYAGFAQA